MKLIFQEDDRGYSIQVGGEIFRCDKGDDYESPTFWYPEGGNGDDLPWNRRENLADLARVAARFCSCFQF